MCQLFSDDVTQFLRSWFSKLQTSVKDFVDTNKRENKTDNERHLTKREIQPPQNFEEVEHDYLLLLSGEYLKQLFDYAKFISSDDKTRDGIDRVLQSEIDRLQHMTLEQLKAYCSKLHDMMARGVSLNNEITVNGNTYSLESIAHVCCPWG